MCKIKCFLVRNHHSNLNFSLYWNNSSMHFDTLFFLNASWCTKRPIMRQETKRNPYKKKQCTIVNSKHNWNTKEPPNWYVVDTSLSACAWVCFFTPLLVCPKSCSSAQCPKALFNFLCGRREPHFQVPALPLMFRREIKIIDLFLSYTSSNLKITKTLSLNQPIFVINFLK